MKIAAKISGKTLVRVLLPGILLLASCAPQHPKDMAAVEGIRAALDSLLQVGARQPDGDPAPFTLENLRIVRRAEENEPDSVQRLRLTILRRHLASEMLARSTHPAADAPALARETGFSSAREMIEEVYGFSFAATRALAESLLSRTDSLALALGEERFLPSPPEVERSFESPALLPAARSTFRLMGGDSAAVMEKLRAKGGLDGYTESFDEMGSALYDANVTERALEFRSLADRTIDSTFRSLAEGILSNPAWMRQNLGMPVPVLKTYARLIVDRRLFVARLRAGMIISNLTLRPDGEPGLLHAEGGVPLLARLPAWFRAAMLSAQLDAWLRSRYGVNWYENPEAAETLRGIWSQGGRLNAEGLLRKIGASEIRTDEWLRSVNELLLLSSR